MVLQVLRTGCSSRAAALVAAAGLTLIAHAPCAHAGKQLHVAGARRSSWQAPASAQDLEQRLTPYLEARRAAPGRPRSAITAQPPSQADLYTLARFWKQLSPSFRELYLSATQIPPGMRTFATPGGHCEVVYATSGTDAVDAADRYGYLLASWRDRTFTPNGVPDYVDEVAWACDSAWAMEVERLAFRQPHAYTSSAYTSGRYKVAVLELPYGLYGQTMPGAPASSPEIGFQSYFEVRNNWDGAEWRNVGGNNYEANPELAIRITCAHEFLHGVQYAMCHEVSQMVYVDDYPVTWLEATAALMEDLGYDSINDYVQYGDTYFNHPEYGLFRRSPYDLYESVVAGFYLYEFCPGGAGISFIRDVYFANYAAAAPFGTNLRDVSQGMGTEWRRLLGEFHARSFYTADRAKAGWYLKDAALLPKWSFTVVGAAASAVWDTVMPYAMARFGRRRDPADSDTMRVCTAVRRIGTGRQDSLWTVALLLRARGRPSFDSMVVRPIGLNGVDTIVVTPWSAYDTALALVSNASGSSRGVAIVAYNTPIPEPPPDDYEVPLAVFPNPVRIGTQQDVIVQGSGIARAAFYTTSGMLVYSAAMPQDSTRMVWPLSAAKHRIVPGTYIAVLQLDPTEHREGRTKRMKILAVP